MKKFKFRLERILQYRMIVKSEKLRELLARNHQLLEDQERLKELDTAMLQNSLTDKGETNARTVYLVGFYGNRLKEEIDTQRLKVLASERAVEAAMADYVEASREAKTMETLKEKKLAEYKDYVEKEEAKIADEINVQKGNSFRQI